MKMQHRIQHVPSPPHNSRTQNGSATLWQFLQGRGILCGILMGVTLVSSPSTSGAISLLEAVDSNDLLQINQLLLKGDDINQKRSDGVTPLHIASYHGNHTVVQLLIDHGAIVNAKDHDEETPLHVAANSGHADIVDLLIGHGGVINGKTLQGWSPLHYAAASGHEEVAKILIAYGADVNARETGTGGSPLHWAVFKNFSGMVKLLLSHGGQVSIRDNAGNTPLSLARHKEKVALLTLLQEASGRHSPKPQAIPEQANAKDGQLTTTGESTSSHNLTPSGHSTKQSLNIIDLDQREWIRGEHFFFVTDSHHWIMESSTHKSPLRPVIPEEISMSKSGKDKTVGAVMVQEAPTVEGKKHTLEGGDDIYPGYFGLVVGILIGIILAPYFESTPFLGALLGGVVGTIGLGIMMQSITRFSNDMNVHVDNANEKEMILQVDSYQPIRIPPKTQVIVKLEEGDHQFEMKDPLGTKNFESFRLPLHKPRNGRKKLSGHFIYNLGGKNSYQIFHVEYKRQ